MDEKITVSAEHKERVKGFKLKAGQSFTTVNAGTEVQVTVDDSRLDGTARLTIDSQWVHVDDALELSAFFARLAKTLHKRNPDNKE